MPIMPQFNLSAADEALITSHVVIALKRDQSIVEYSLPEKAEELKRLGRQLVNIQYEIKARLEAC